MSPEKTPPSAEVIEAAAAAWLSLRDRGMTPEETAGFVHWLQQDARHAEIFSDLDGVWQDFDRLAGVPATPTGPIAPPDADLLAPRVRPRRNRTLAWTMVGAAAAAVVLLAVSPFHSRRHTAETAVGAFEKVDLPDGSVAQLNTDSAIDTSFTAGERRVRLVRGEAHFSIVKDPTRPFIVTAGSVAVRAVGTAFNVRHHEAALEVLVTEGRVSVDDVRRGQSVLTPPFPDLAAEPPLLIAGERAVVPMSASQDAVLPATAKVEKMSPVDVKRALAWQERRLEFESVPLAEVVHEFNRYNRRQLVIDDASLAAKRFSGTFRADGYESLVRLLETDFGVTVTHQDTAIVLRAGR